MHNQNLTYFPKSIGSKAIITYLVALIAVTLVWYQHVTPMLWWVWGLVEVFVFFYFSNVLSKEWTNLSPKTFEHKIFWYSFFISFVYVVVTYFLYIELRGEPFEYDPSDGLSYHEDGQWYIECLRIGNPQLYWNWLFSQNFDDVGYPAYIGILYSIIGDNIFITRLIKCVCRAWVCVLIYRIASRNFGDSVGKMAAIFCMLLPNFSFYAASHRKEMEMVMLVVWFMDQADLLSRTNKFQMKQFFLPVILILGLFTFRTVLGIAALFALAVTLLFTSENVKGKRKRVQFAIVLSIVIISMSGNIIYRQIEDVYSAKMNNQQGKDMEWRSKRGNELAKYASSTVFAPLIVAIPFPTMVDVSEQYNQQRLNGGYYVKNILAFFVLLSLWYIVKNKLYRRHLLIYIYTFSYLLIIAFSNFAHSERFHLPAVPFLMIMAAYGVSLCKKSQYRYFNAYAWGMCLAAIAWNWFKLSGRGLI